MNDVPGGRAVLRKILDLARWAPSGDNTQPWRFQIVSDDSLIVYGHDTRDEILYDFDGHASHMAHGALLETLRIAASAEGLEANWTYSVDREARNVEYRVQFVASGRVEASPLYSFIKKRTVQRRPMRLVPLNDIQKAAFRSAAGDRFEIQFFDSFAQRRAIAGLLWANAHIRLTCPEAFPVHQQIIEWGAQFSKDRIPEQAVGVDRATAKLMRWVMKSWARVDFFNRYLMGTIAPRIQLDYLPALLCSAHILIRPKSLPSCLADWVEAGAAMQRVWLTATQHGMHLQPEMTPVIFRWYSQANRSFSVNPQYRLKASALAGQFERISQAGPSDGFSFLGRVGFCAPPASRSLRFDLDELLKAD